MRHHCPMISSLTNIFTKTLLRVFVLERASLKTHAKTHIVDNNKDYKRTSLTNAYSLSCYLWTNFCAFFNYLNFNFEHVCFFAWSIPDFTLYSKAISKVRSSDLMCSIKKGVLKNFATFTEKHLCQILFFNKVRPATLLKKRLWHRCFAVNFERFLKTPIFIEHLQWLLLQSHVKIQSSWSEWAKSLQVFLLVD